MLLYDSGYSKILLPGTPICYLIAEGATWEQLLKVKQAADVCTPGLNQRAMHHYLQTGALVGHLDRVRQACRERRDVALSAARQHLPRDAHWTKPPGGLYLWIELPLSGPTAAELYVSAIQHGVAFAIGSMFHPDGSSAYYIRIHFAPPPPCHIESGMRRLAATWPTTASCWRGTTASPPSST